MYKQKKGESDFYRNNQEYLQFWQMCFSNCITKWQHSAKKNTHVQNLTFQFISRSTKRTLAISQGAIMQTIKQGLLSLKVHVLKFVHYLKTIKLH